MAKRTKYQKVLALFSANAHKKYSTDQMIQILEDFLDETKEMIESGLEVKKIAAIQKLKNVASLFGELQEEGILIADQRVEKMHPELYQKIKERIEPKIQKIFIACGIEIDSGDSPVEK